MLLLSQICLLAWAWTLPTDPADLRTRRPNKVPVHLLPLTLFYLTFLLLWVFLIRLTLYMTVVLLVFVLIVFLSWV